MSDKQEKLVKLFSSSQIRERVMVLACKISEEYIDRNPILVGVLNGSFIFLADLVRSITIECEIDFIHATSYTGKKSSGIVTLNKGFSLDIRNRDIILIEDIIDTGLTIDYARKLALNMFPKSIEIGTLLLKKDKDDLDFPVRYIGFEIPQLFVVGYGLDYDQKMRNLDSINTLENDNKFQGSIK